MNRYGFTLVELLAVIVIIGIVSTFTITSISANYQNSKLQSEEIFKNKITTIIESYIMLHTKDFIFSNGTITKQKCDSTGVQCYSVDVSRTNFKLFKLIDDNLVSSNDLINPNGKKKCNLDSTIDLYKDSDYVYCFSITLDCLTDDDNVINTCNHR